MKALFLENVNDIPYMMAEQWRTWGHDARLVARGRGLLPLDWSVPGAHGKAGGRPDWVTVVDAPSRSFYHRAPALLRMRRAVEKHRMPVIANSAGGILMLGSKVRTALWLHGFDLKQIPFLRPPARRWQYAALMRAAIKKAEVIISNQPDHAEAIRRLGIAHKTQYVHTPISCAFWKPTGAAPPPGAFRILVASGTDFLRKGTDNIIRGFADFLGRYPDSRPASMTLRDFGQDVERARGLVHSLGIEGRVEFKSIGKAATFRKTIPTATQPADMETYHCVIDSVGRGIIGMAALEGMAMNKPVICWAPEEHYGDKYEKGDAPPLINARTPRDIADALAEIHGGAAFPGSREWVLKYHDAPVVARSLLGHVRGFLEKPA